MSFIVGALSTAFVSVVQRYKIKTRFASFSAFFCHFSSNVKILALLRDGVRDGMRD
jgi:hypothetical protein